MPSLIGRKNGFKVNPLRGSKGNIVLKTNSLYYENYIDLRSDDKAIMDTLLYVTSTNTNHFVVANDTIDLIVRRSGYAESTIMNALTRLHSKDLIHTITLPYEYIVNPLFAIKGSECEVWQFIQLIQYKGDIPRDVILDCSTIRLNSNY